MKLTQNHINQILNSVNLGHIEKGLQLATNLLKTNADSLQLNKLIAYMYSMKGKHHLSIKVLNNIKNKYPSDFDISNNLGHSYLNEENIKLALENINNAIKIDSNNPAPYKNLASVYLLLRDFNKAENAINRCHELIEKTLGHSEQLSSVIKIKSQIMLAKNQKNIATELLLNYLDKNFDPELLLELVNIDRSAITEGHLSRTKELINNNIYNSQLDKFNKLSPLLFFLAKYYEKNNQLLSEKYYDEANLEVKKVQRLQVIVFQKKFKDIIDSYSEIKDLEVTENQYGKENIFIVGMPRSGTSLLESVITANNQVFPGGELKAMGQLYDRFEETKKIDPYENLNFIGKEYSNITKNIKGNYESIVDKMPLNFSLIGFILKALPKAKVILILRNPWDIAISLYKQRYVQNITFAASFFNIGVYIANFEAIVNYWLNFSEIKNRIYTLRYENLVNFFESERKSIYKFCEINSPYQEKVRETHFVRTASMHQIQGKIHNHSVKKKSFEAGKLEFFDAYYSQVEYWKSINNPMNDGFFGYLKS